MIWIQKQEGQLTRCRLELPDASWDSIDRGVSELFEKLLSLILADLGPDEADLVYCQFWPDSGRIMTFPNKVGQKWKSDYKIYAELYSPLIQQQFDSLPDSEVNEETFLTAFAQLEARVREIVRTVLFSPPISDLLKSLQQRNKMSILWNTYDGDEIQLA